MPAWLTDQLREDAMIEIIEILRQEHRNIEKLLGVLERELNVFGRGDRPDYEVVLAVVDYFKGYPDSCHHPKEDIIVEKFKARDPLAASTIGDLAAEHREGARRLQRVAQAVEDVLSDQGLLRQTVNDIVRDFVNHERRHMAMEERVVFPGRHQGAAVRGLGRYRSATGRSLWPALRIKL
jgi:hemerythrin-like domain-containing protein